MAIKPAAEPRMSVRAVIIKVSCPAIHAVAYGTSNPKILTGNDKDVMSIHFDRGCDVFATQQRRTDANEQENSSPTRIPVIYERPLRRQNAYQHFHTHALSALYRAGKSCSYCKSAGPNRPAVLGETVMKLGAAIAEIMKREGIEILCGYPVN